MKQQPLDRGLLRQLSAELTSLYEDMLRLEGSLRKRTVKVDESHRSSARNLAHYLALRRHDLRQLQSQLAVLGLSSLGRTEGHAMRAVEAVHGVLEVLVGEAIPLRESAEACVDFAEGAEFLKRNTEALLGPAPQGRGVRIMVTMASDAATDYTLVRDLVAKGMDCMRINCAHDGPDAWLSMIEHLKKACRETGRPCKILMDLPGPKLRTGPIEAGPAVIRCRPKRDTYGRVTAPARIWLTPEEKPGAPPAAAAACLPLPGKFLRKLHKGDTLRLRDARDAGRALRVMETTPEGCWAEARHTTYFVPGLEVHAEGRRTKNGKSVSARGKARVGQLPPVPQTLLLKPGDKLVLTRGPSIGKAAVCGKRGEIMTPASIGVSLPEILEHARVGDPIWFDDGKIGSTIHSVESESVCVEITQARAEGEKLGAEKGINLPETQIDIPALTAEDAETLKFIVRHADIVGYSFVRTEHDVEQLLDRLEDLNGKHLGVVLKIETRKGFDNLPNLILTAMRAEAVGIMIARGDLAVECGYERLAEVQEEVLWICEAAHVPAIWATQVLETMAKKGLPSRSEVTDAAMGERAECVMLNKGPYTVTTVQVLANILKRMEAHQNKKRSMLRELQVATNFATAD